MLKVVILGNGGVGKSSLMNRFVNNEFDSQSFHTIGVEFLNKDLVIEGDTYTMQIWDTAGQEVRDSPPSRVPIAGGFGGTSASGL